MPEKCNGDQQTTKMREEAEFLVEVGLGLQGIKVPTEWRRMMIEVGRRVARHLKV